MLWTAADQLRAPVGDFPPRWASGFGDDRYGLFADLVIGEATQRMRWVEPGRFLMGSTPTEQAKALEGLSAGERNDWKRWFATESPRHEVNLTRGFWLADTPCTQAFWLATVGGKNPSHFSGDEKQQHPVEQVAWDDIVERFFVRLKEQLSRGSEPALPSEAQWEYAARAGTSTAYWWGDEPDSSRVNWNQEHGGTTPVKRFEPNAWGLFDMHGNVWEWCEGYRRTYSEGSVNDPQDAEDSRLRALRGGSWLHAPRHARAASRYVYVRVNRFRSIGFRLALRSASPASQAARRAGERAEPA